MATSVNIDADLKQYLASSHKSNASNSKFTDFFKLNGNKKGSNWLYSPLSTNDDDEEPEDTGASNESVNVSSWFPSLTRTQRIIGFSICLGMGVTCFILASLFIPVLLLKARKFALLFTLGSVFILCSFSFLSGPWNHFKHLFSKDRVLFTLCYLGTLISTLYVSLSLQSTVLTVVFGLLQIIALIWYVISYLPGGQTGLMFFSKIVTKAASRTLPV